MVIFFEDGLCEFKEKSTSVDRGHEAVSGLAPDNEKERKKNDRLVILPVIYYPC